MTKENKLWRIIIDDLDKVWLVVAKTSEDALGFARVELEKAGYVEEDDYDFGYPENWDLKEGSIIDPQYEDKI